MRIAVTARVLVVVLNVANLAADIVVNTRLVSAIRAKLMFKK